MARGRRWRGPLSLLVHARRHPRAHPRGRDAERSLTPTTSAAGPEPDSAHGGPVVSGESRAGAGAGGVLPGQAWKREAG